MRGRQHELHPVVVLAVGKGPFAFRHVRQSEHALATIDDADRANPRAPLARRYVEQGKGFGVLHDSVVLADHGDRVAGIGANDGAFAGHHAVAVRRAVEETRITEHEHARLLYLEIEAGEV